MADNEVNTILETLLSLALSYVGGQPSPLPSYLPTRDLALSAPGFVANIFCLSRDLWLRFLV